MKNTEILLRTYRILENDINSMNDYVALSNIQKHRQDELKTCLRIITDVMQYHAQLSMLANENDSTNSE